MTRTRPRKRFLIALFCAVIVNASCVGGGSGGNSNDDPDITLDDVDTSLTPLANDLQDNASFYLADGYEPVSMLDLVLRTNTIEGTCDEVDISGCQLADVLNDTDGSDEFEPEIAVHFSATDYADDGSAANAMLKQRGDTARQAEQKSFAVKLDDDLPLWRRERRLQLNKHPFDVERIRNKLSFDLMQDIEHLNSLRTQFVRLQIQDNGQTTDYGVYTHIESVGDDYLANRGYDADSALYKSVNFTFDRLADRLQIDSTGAVLDEAQFERNLEIKTGDNHSALISMLDSLNDPTSDKSALLATHFNENNIATWLAVNILLGNANTVYENYYLFNPASTDDFYLLPWDYDSAFKTEADPDDYSGQEQIRRRMIYGVSKWWESRLIREWLQQPGAWEKLRGRVYSLRQNELSNRRISALIETYQDTIQPYLLNEPDLTYLYGTDDQNKVIEWFTHIEEMPGRVGENYSRFFNDPGWPMSFALNEAVVSNGEVTFSWAPSHDFQGDALAYTLEVAPTPAFDQPVYRQSNIAHAPIAGADGEDQLSLVVPTASIGNGTFYWRVIAFELEEPADSWRPANSRVAYDGQTFYGASALAID